MTDVDSNGADTIERQPLPPPVADTISLLDLFAVLVKRRALIITTTLVAAALVVAFCFVTIRLPPDSPWNYLPNVYRPTVRVLVKTGRETQGAIDSLLSGSASSLASLMGVGTGANTSAELAQALLEGNDIKDQIAEKFNFIQRYNITSLPKTTARGRIESSVETEYRADSNILEISYKDIDAVFATEVLTEIVRLLEMKFRELTLDKVTRKKRFLEERLEDVWEELSAAQTDLAEFQKAYGIIDVSAEATERIRLVADLKGQVINKEIDLQTRSEYLKEDDPQIVRLRNEIDKLEDFIRELKQGFEQYSGAQTIPQDEISEITPRYLNLRRDLTIQESIYSMLRQQFETAKIEETDTSQMFQIIEEAEVPELKYGPSRAKICAIITLTAFFLAVFLAFVKEYFEKVRKDPIESAKLEAIQRMLSRRKR